MKIYLNSNKSTILDNGVIINTYPIRTIIITGGSFINGIPTVITLSGLNSIPIMSLLVSECYKESGLPYSNYQELLDAITITSDTDELTFALINSFN